MGKGEIKVTWLTDTWGFTKVPTWENGHLTGRFLYQPVIKVHPHYVITEGLYFSTEHSLREYVQQQLLIRYIYLTGMKE